MLASTPSSASRCALGSAQFPLERRACQLPTPDARHASRCGQIASVAVGVTAFAAYWHRRRAILRAAAPPAERKLVWRSASGNGKIVPITSPVQAVAKTADKGLKTLNIEEQIERLFSEEVTQDDFAPNCWYESPDYMVTSKARVCDWWRQERPTRELERVCGGKGAGGCTWRQLDGRRGISYIRFDRDGQVAFMREVGEVDAWAKSESNPMAASKPITGLMGGITGFLNTFDQYLTVDENKGKPWLPRFGLARPRSSRADDVVQFLWDEAQMQEDGINKCLAEYSQGVTFEDLVYKDERWPQSLEALREYFKEVKESSPEGLRWVLDEVSDSAGACVAVWHCEAFGQKSPRGLSYYEVDSDGKVTYVRMSYNPSF